MSVQVFGSSDGSTLTLYKGFPIATREGYAWTVTYRYWCQMVLAEALIPAAYAACPHPNHATCKLAETTLSENGTPGMCDVTLVYKLPGSSGMSSSHEANEVVQTATAGWDEVPLDDPRLVTDGVLTQDEVDGLIAGGHRTQGIGTVEYSYTQYLDSFTWSQANLITGIGNTEAPDGMSSATKAKWLFVGMTVRSDGDLVEKTKTWRYNRLGWKTS